MRVLDAAAELRPEADAESPRVGAHLVDEGTGWRGRGVRVADAGPGRRVEDARGVANRARQHVLVRRHRPVLAEVRPEGGACP